jgi:hypothetical protein
LRVPALELGTNMNIRREDAEHFRLRVSTEEQLLLRNIVTVLQANPDNLTLPECRRSWKWLVGCYSINL